MANPHYSAAAVVLTQCAATKRSRRPTQNPSFTLRAIVHGAAAAGDVLLFLQYYY